MKVCCCIVKRNESISVRTLHTIIRLVTVSRALGAQVSIEYMNEIPLDTVSILKKLIKQNDRIIWLGYGTGVTDDTKEVDVLMSKYPQGYYGSILPCARKGIDWDAFVSKMKNGSTETPGRAGIRYDTTVSKTKISDDTYDVQTVHNPNIWSFDCKQFLKKMKGKKGDGLVIPTDGLVAAMLKNGIKMCAHVSVRTNITYTHECIGSIIESAANRP